MVVAQWHKACLASTRPWDRLLSLKQVYLLHFKKKCVGVMGEPYRGCGWRSKDSTSSQFSPAVCILRWNWGCQTYPLSHLTSPGHHHLKIRSYMESYKKHGHSRVWKKLAASTASHRPARITPLERYR